MKKTWARRKFADSEFWLHTQSSMQSTLRWTQLRLRAARLTAAGRRAKSQGAGGNTQKWVGRAVFAVSVCRACSRGCRARPGAGHGKPCPWSCVAVFAHLTTERPGAGPHWNNAVLGHVANAAIPGEGCRNTGQEGGDKRRATPPARRRRGLGGAPLAFNPASADKCAQRYTRRRDAYVSIPRYVYRYICRAVCLSAAGTRTSSLWTTFLFLFPCAICPSAGRRCDCGGHGRVHASYCLVRLPAGPLSIYLSIHPSIDRVIDRSLCLHIYMYIYIYVYT